MKNTKQNRKNEPIPYSTARLNKAKRQTHQSPSSGKERDKEKRNGNSDDSEGQYKDENPDEKDKTIVGGDQQKN